MDEPEEGDEVVHSFDLTFSNPIHSWRARCGCDEDFGFANYVTDLADQFDRHLEAIGADWWNE